MNSNVDIDRLKSISRDVRISIVRSLAEAGSGHLGGSLGMTDVFVSLYFHAMRHDPSNPLWKERDRLILSNGHIAPVLYATLAHAGYFDVEELMTLRKLGSRLQGHPGRDKGLPGIELSAGSLGQGICVATGLSLAARTDGRDWRVFCLMGDGELQEGSVWEAAMCAAHYNLDNLIVIIDRNRLQIDGPTAGVMEIEPLAGKWKAFGWHVDECDGHDHEDIIRSIDQAYAEQNKSSVIIAHTVMGKGIASIENDFRWHGKAPAKEQAAEFIKELTERF